MSDDSPPHRRIDPSLISRGGRGRAGSRKRLRRCLVLGPLACAAEVGASYKGEWLGFVYTKNCAIIFHHIPLYSTTLHTSSLSVYIYIIYIYIFITIYVMIFYVNIILCRISPGNFHKFPPWLQPSCLPVFGWPTPLKNDGEFVSWDDCPFPRWWEN